MNTSEILDKAADVLVEHGHCKGALRSRDGRYCAAGAMRVAAGVMSFDGSRAQGSAEQWDDYLAAWDALRGHIGVTVLTNWNDSPTRTADDVVEALRAAARAER